MDTLGAGPRDHIVFFYADDHDLVEKVGGYLHEALRRDGAVIVIGTSAHRAAIARWLAFHGVRLADAEAAGAYQVLDAAQTLGQFMVGGRADPARFWQQLSPIIRRATEHGGPVRMFGEMVSLLWDRGLPQAAVEVEAMWNELGAQYPFSLACAYATPEALDDAGVDALTEVCRSHAAVAGDPPPAVRGWRY